VENKRFKDWYIWLPVLALASIPFGRSVEFFVAVMAIIGIVDLVNDRGDIRQHPAIKLFSFIFLVLWIPGLISIIDAVNVERTAKTVLSMPRFYFAGVFIISRVSEQSQHSKIALGFTAVVSFWAIDGLIQAFTGTDLLGIETAKHAGRISGIFGENARLGLTIVPFLALSFLTVKNKITSILVLLLLVTMILLSGDRASWVSLIVALFMLAWFNRERLVSLSIQAYVISAIGIIFMGGALISSPSFQKRINSVEVGFEGGYEAINKASSSRLPLWGTAIRMFQDNYVNGVGVRSFRYAYPDYAEQDDPFVNFSLPRYKQTGQTHAHQVVLEFASDTGVVGLIGYFIVIYMLYFWLLPVVFQQKYLLASGYMIAVTVGLFPINTHQSFFSSHWGQIIWMLIALGVSSLTVQAGRENFTLTKMKLMRK
jgi:hypothetical protein